MTRQVYLDIIIYKKTASPQGQCFGRKVLPWGPRATRSPRWCAAFLAKRRRGHGFPDSGRAILDYTPSAHTGKPANNDPREGKITLPLPLSDRVEERCADLAGPGWRSCREDDDAVEYLRSVVENEGGLAAAEVVMQATSRGPWRCSPTTKIPEYRSALINPRAYISSSGTADTKKLINQIDKNGD